MLYIEPHLKAPFLDHLQRNERITWAGQAQQGIVFQAKDWFLIPFSLIWCSISFTWIIFAAQSSPFFALFGIPFVIIGLILLIGRFFIDSRTRSRTYYAITNERILIKVEGSKDSLTTVTISEDTAVRLHLKNGSPNDVGTIYFSDLLAFLKDSNQPQLKSFSKSTYSFFRIPNASKVHRLILDHQKDLRKQHEEK